MNLLTTFKEQGLNFINGFFGTPALIIGLFALIGCLVQRKKFTEILTSVFKTVIGFLIIGGGAGIIAGSIGKFGSAFNLLFGREGWLANNDVMPGLHLAQEGLAQIATAGSLILVFALLLNVLIAKLSNLKYIYLTGHSAWYFSTMIASVLYLGGIKDTQDVWLIVLTGSLLVSMWMVLSPALLNRHSKIITKGNSLAVAHTGSITYALSGYIGELIYKMKKGNVKSTEEINFPKGLAFLRNTNVSIALTMFILFSIVYYTAWGVKGFEAMVAAGILGQNDSPIAQGIIQAFTFAAGVEVLLIGVRMFIAELVPAFKGFAEKVVRGSKPGIDCPIVFPFAPNAVIMGFIASTIGGFIAFAINIGISNSVGAESVWAAIVIPSVVPHFFTGATSGVFGNAKGGIIGCWVGAFINGLIISLVPYLFIVSGLTPAFSSGGSRTYITWGDADFIVGVIPALITKYAGKWALLGITLAAWAMFPGISAIMHIARLKNQNYKNVYENNKKVYTDKATELKEARINHSKQIKELNDELKQKSAKTEKDEVRVKIDNATKEYNKQVREISKKYDSQLLEYRKE
ncbi:PTS system, ascorbate-specific IIC component [Spiroplasma helicoides]|uniref:Ascorbate-specific PTS system EIIC component n=1 Tax=Spiroplasma helicoides TaxID=216938 RepID=A0A1B3SM28_9MOLU|nr:PTS ascorbate transporter subunit IIC [Spiroplasma helicoides]AOG60967.1 PTS system, ascorbate-specific IIC component [Spiroplasma helicoides]